MPLDDEYFHSPYSKIAVDVCYCFLLDPFFDPTLHSAALGRNRKQKSVIPSVARNLLTNNIPRPTGMTGFFNIRALMSIPEEELHTDRRISITHAQSC